MKNKLQLLLQFSTNSLSKMKVLTTLFIVIVLVGVIGYAFILYGGKLVFDEEKIILDAATTIETMDGQVVGELYNEYRLPVDITEIPEHVRNAFIAIEDRRFYDHAGVDFKSVVRAVVKDIISRSKVEGASTITQQVAKNIFLYHDKTWMRKTKEAMAAIYLERNFSKDHILELYLNAIYFGHGLYGIEAASQEFFSKHVSELTLSEGALLAGLVKAPNSYSPLRYPDKALERRNIVLRAMNDVGTLTTERRLVEEGKTLGVQQKKQEKRIWNDSYVDLVTKEVADRYNLSISEIRRGGYRIVVHLNEMAQKIAYEQFQDDAHFPGNTEGVEGAFVMTKFDTGRIVAAIGGRSFLYGDLNRVDVQRQPGSTMKPIAVYAPALMKKAYHPFSLIPDYQMDIDGYNVANSDGKYEGSVSVYRSVMQSKNTSAVWLLNQIGVDYAKSYLEKMDIMVPDEGLAIALGGLRDGLTPLNMAAAYGTLANHGEYRELYTIDRIYNRNNELIHEATPKKNQVITSQVAWNMTEMLINTVENGTASAGEYIKALAGKTGSTEHNFVKGKNKDIWFVGYTPEYVTSLWIGYDRSDKEHFLTGGSSYPTALTKEILSEIDKLRPLKATFTKPDDVNDLPKPIDLPEITNVSGKLEFGGISLIRGRISWTGSHDNRIIYRIYRKEDEIDNRVGEVTGKTEFIISDISLFRPNEYYVVPYDPLTKLEGKRSDIIEISF